MVIFIVEPHLVMKFEASQEECDAHTHFHTKTHTQVESVGFPLGGSNSILLVLWGPVFILRSACRDNPQKFQHQHFVGRFFPCLLMQNICLRPSLSSIYLNYGFIRVWKQQIYLRLNLVLATSYYASSPLVPDVHSLSVESALRVHPLNVCTILFTWNISQI